MGPYTLLVTFEEKPDPGRRVLPTRTDRSRLAPKASAVLRPGSQSNAGGNRDRCRSPQDMLKLDPLELPAEFRLLSTAPPSLGTWQYTERPFDLNLKGKLVPTRHDGDPGRGVFSEANTRVSQDGELVTDVLYYVKSRGQPLRSS